MTRSTFVYVTYIRSTPEKVWAALTESDFMRQYWFGCHCDSRWQAGAPWKLISPDGQVFDSGEIIEANPPRRLVIRWQNQFRPDLKAEGPSICTIELEPFDGAVKLSITHSNDVSPSKFIEAVSGGWPKIMSNLKSLLETGSVAFSQPYPTQQRAEA